MLPFFKKKNISVPYTYTYMCVCIYIYIERERERVIGSDRKVCFFRIFILLAIMGFKEEL